jgi:hypothetical protein
VQEPENKKPPDSGETENEGIHVPRKTVPWLASSFSLTEKLAGNNSGPTSVTKLMS